MFDKCIDRQSMQELFRDQTAQNKDKLLGDEEIAQWFSSSEEHAVDTSYCRSLSALGKYYLYNCQSQSMTQNMELIGFHRSNKTDLPGGSVVTSFQNALPMPNSVREEEHNRDRVFAKL
jgi:site-specific recombinase XerD